MLGFFANIEQQTLSNKNFRKVLYTGSHLQLVLMSLLPGEEIGLETHEENDQFIRVESGEGKCLMDDHEYILEDGSALVVPAGVEHNIVNTSEEDPLKLYTIYAPPHHEDGLIHKTKEDAEQDEDDHYSGLDEE